jgi:hypothetical protein
MSIGCEVKAPKRLIQVVIDRDLATVLNDRAHRDGVPKGTIVNDALRRLFDELGGDERRSRTA